MSGERYSCALNALIRSEIVELEGEVVANFQPNQRRLNTLNIVYRTTDKYKIYKLKPEKKKTIEFLVVNTRN